MGYGSDYEVGVWARAGTRARIEPKLGVWPDAKAWAGADLGNEAWTVEVVARIDRGWGWTGAGAVAGAEKTTNVPLF